MTFCNRDHYEERLENEKQRRIDLIKIAPLFRRPIRTENCATSNITTKIHYVRPGIIIYFGPCSYVQTTYYSATLRNSTGSTNVSNHRRPLYHFKADHRSWFETVSELDVTN